ncbi:MAG: GxxExxY protein [Gloeotrichia echinulata IR180]|jgi:GxxExxY protein|nr:GxxExxY protein [Gloeotrichia echinulata DEX184]
MNENEIAKEIVDAAYKVHTTLGPGLLESVYQKVMEYELGKRGLRVEAELPIPVVYRKFGSRAAVRRRLFGKIVATGRALSVGLGDVRRAMPAIAV